MHSEHPDLIKDQYWDDIDFELPYTAAAEPYRNTSPHLGSAMDIRLLSLTLNFIFPFFNIQFINPSGL